METPVNEAKIELKENIQKLLLENIYQFNRLEATKEIPSDVKEPHKLHTFEVIEGDTEAYGMKIIQILTISDFMTILMFFFLQKANY